MLGHSGTANAKIFGKVSNRALSLDQLTNDEQAVAIGQRVGVPWMGQTCGSCAYCRAGQENLCDHPQFTGCTRDGGYASHVVADARYCFAIPPRFSDTEGAPS